jgi:N-acetyl sugar amidotransferase
MIEFCTKCVTPNSRPRIVFNKDNICNACINNENKKTKIDWTVRENEFDKIVKKINDETKNDTYNCLVPWSGGKDSTFIALKLKYKFGLRPLLATFAPLIPNEIGIHNREIVLKHGFDGIYFRPNQKVARNLSKRFFFERGNPKVAWDAGINSMPVNTAIKYGIKNIFYAEHGESEYGGLVLDEESKKRRNEREVIEHIIGDYPQNWVNNDITEYDIQPYIYPDDTKLEKHQISSHYFAYYFKWSINENYEFVKSVLPDFKLNSFGRTEGTFTNFDSLDDKN